MGMKEEKNRKFITWGVTAFCVIAASLALSFLMNRFETVQHFFQMLTRILMPIIWGLVMAFLFAPMYNHIVSGMGRALRKNDRMKKKTAGSLSRFTATLSCIVCLIVIVAGLFAMLIPQLLDSIRSMFTAIPKGLNGIYGFLNSLFTNLPDVHQWIMDQYENITDFFSRMSSDDLMPNINKYLANFSTGVLKVFNGFMNFGIGIIVMAYILNIKGTLSAQAKMIIYSLLPLEKANDFIEEARYVKNVFSNFIVGKLIDSAIIGVLCFILMSILRLPYSLLISVFVGVTNIIPFFGPFIGAIPSGFILLVISPFQCFKFIILIFVLQQFDGNILGPKILGQTTGLSSFWVLFSILFFGGLWGIVGMIIGVPTFAVIYRLVGRHVMSRLEKRHLSFKTEDYWNLKQIDMETGEYIKKTETAEEEGSGKNG